MNEPKTLSRGLRNRNPGNIRRSTTTYRGEAPSADPAFKTFETMAWGYRAMFVLLHTYRVRHGCDTLQRMIGRYAPPSENHTQAYVRAVAAATGIGPDEQVDTRQRETMTALVAAMSAVENGVAARMSDVTEGWKLYVTYPV